MPPTTRVYYYECCTVRNVIVVSATCGGSYYYGYWYWLESCHLKFRVPTYKSNLYIDTINKLFVCRKFFIQQRVLQFNLSSTCVWASILITKNQIILHTSYYITRSLVPFASFSSIIYSSTLLHSYTFGVGMAILTHKAGTYSILPHSGQDSTSFVVIRIRTEIIFASRRGEYVNNYIPAPPGPHLISSVLKYYSILIYFYIYKIVHIYINIFSSFPFIIFYFFSYIINLIIFTKDSYISLGEG